MKDIQQLIKQNNDLGYENIYPKSYIDAIIDKESGMALQDILNSFNMYFLSYNGNAEHTRLQVPKILRRKGLWITYVKYNNTIVTEWYNGNSVEDSIWGKDENWNSESNYAKLRKGTTSQRPANVHIGFIYKDTDLNKWIIWNGTDWENLDSTSL